MSEKVKSTNLFTILLTILKNENVVKILQKSQDQILKVLKGKLIPSYFRIAAVLFKYKVVSHDEIRKNVITHPGLIPLLVDTKPQSKDAQWHLVCFLFLFFSEYPKQCPLSLVPFIMVLYRATNSATDKLILSLLFILSSKGEIHIPMVTGYLWGQNAMDYLSNSKRNGISNEDTMKNAVWKTQSLFQEGLLFDQRILKDTHSRILELIDCKLQPDMEYSNHTVGLTLFEGKKDHKNSEISDLYDIAFIFQILDFSFQFPKWETNYFYYCWGMKFCFVGASLNCVEIRNIANRCISKYQKKITTIPEGKQNQSNDFIQQKLLLLKLKNSYKEENDQIPVYYAVFLGQCFDIFSHYNHFLFRDTMDFISQRHFAFDFKKIPFFDDIFSEEHLDYRKIKWILKIVTYMTPTTGNSLKHVLHTMVPYLTTLLDSEMSVMVEVRKLIYTFLENLTYSIPNELLKIGVLSWINNKILPQRWKALSSMEFSEINESIKVLKLVVRLSVCLGKQLLPQHDFAQINILQENLKKSLIYLEDFIKNNTVIEPKYITIRDLIEESLQNFENFEKFNIKQFRL